jgi:hypothetical protein
MLRRVALVGTNVSDKFSTSIIRVTRIGEQGTLAVTSKRRTMPRITLSVDGGAEFHRNVGSYKIHTA